MPLIQTEAELLAHLESHQIRYERVAHPPVYTCEEAAQFRLPTPGLDTKNLFLRDGKRSFYMLVTACEKRLDLKGLGRSMGVSKLHFGSEVDLLALLGLTPGSVTLLGLVNDTGGRVRLLVDRQYWPADAYLCHPLVNTATLSVPHDSLMRFLEQTGHAPQVVDVPAWGETAAA
jgi:Ala-tRNA(Pro) deacylase